MLSNEVHAWSFRRISHRSVLRRALALAAGGLVANTIAMAQTATYQTGLSTMNTPEVPRSTEGLALSQPTWGLFIGISDYGDRAGVTSTPAHSLGASLMYEAFYNAARRSDNGSLGIPAKNYSKAHEAAVCDIAFNSDGHRARRALGTDWIMVEGDNRSHFATAAVDGTVALWSLDPKEGDPRMEKSLTTGGESSCALAFNPDGTQLAVAEKGGNVRIWPVWTAGDTILLSHPASVCGVSFNSAGTEILTTLSDGTARVWDRQGRPVFSVPRHPECAPAPEKPSCADAPAAALSPTENLVVTSSCGAIRTWPLEPGSAPALIGKETEIRSVSFSGDGSRILTVAADGAKLLPVHSGAGNSGVFANAGARQARFSPDGGQLVVAGKSGSIAVFDAASMKKQNDLSIHMTDVDSLEFSDDGRYIAVHSNRGTAWVQDIEGLKQPVRVPQPVVLPSRGGSDIKMAIELMEIPAGRRETPLRAVALSPDGNYLIAGLEDGAVGIHAGPHVPGGSRANDHVLLADHRFDNTPLSIMAIWYLQQLNGGSRQLNYSAGDSTTPRHDPGSLSVGSGNPVTRKRVFDELNEMIDRAAWGSRRDSALLVVYVAAHGWIGPDGRKYFLPSDADAHKPETWIAYDDFLKPIEEFVSSDRGAVVVFDTCQVRLGNAAKPAAVPKHEPKELAVFESTSPGQYAWHWAGQMEATDRITTIRKTTHLGIQRTAKPADEKRESTFTARMSVLPVASQWTLADLVDAKRASTSPDDRLISIGEWFVNTRTRMGKLLEGIPEASQIGPAQEMQLRTPEAVNYVLFQVDRTDRQ